MGRAVTDALVVRSCSEVPAAPVRWLWEPFLARGRLAVLDGAPGAGKSLFIADLAARLSRPGALACGAPVSYAHTTILVSAFDDPADTTCPRLRAAGADPDKVLVCGGPGAPVPALPARADALRDLVTERAADLLVLDPLAAFVPKGTERAALAPLAALAAETGCAVLLVRGGRAAHDRDPLGAFGAARTGLVVAAHPDDPDLRVLAQTKSALGGEAAALGFRGTGAPPKLEWVGRVDLSGEELCAAPARAALRPRDRAAAFLNELLANGPRPVLELQHLAAERNLSWATVERAKSALGVRASRERAGDGHQWCWNHPDVLRATQEVTAAMNAMQRYIFRKDTAPLPYDGKRASPPK